MKYSKLSDSYEARTTFTDGNNMAFKTFCFDGITATTSYTPTTGTSWHSNVPGTKYERPYYKIAVTKDSDPARFITVIYPFGTQVPEISANFTSVSKVNVTVGDKNYVLVIE